MQVSPRFHTIDEKLSHFQDENLFLSQLKSSYKNIKAIFHSFNCVVIPFSDAGSKKQLTNVQISFGSESDCISYFGFGDIELNLKRVLKVASIYKKIVSFALRVLATQVWWQEILQQWRTTGRHHKHAQRGIQRTSYVLLYMLIKPYQDFWTKIYKPNVLIYNTFLSICLHNICLSESYFLVIK